jgi:hypothetical protein
MQLQESLNFQDRLDILLEMRLSGVVEPVLDPGFSILDEYRVRTETGGIHHAQHTSRRRLSWHACRSFWSSIAHEPNSGPS